jgi:hypothetical protein
MDNDEKAKTQLEDGENPNDYIDMTGTWFVSFGYGIFIEGSKLFTLGGLFKKETLIEYLTRMITKELPDNAKAILDEHSANIVIRSINRL